MSKIEWPRGCKHDPDCGVFSGPQELGRHYRSAHGTEPAHKAKASSAALVHKPVHKPKRIEVDDVVIPVASRLAGARGTITIAQLEAVLTWRDATVDLLEQF